MHMFGICRVSEVRRQMSRLLRGLGVAMWVFSSWGCTDIELMCSTADCRDGALSRGDNKVLVRGEVCTQPPGAVLYPYKILFVIDVSGSNSNSDPNGARGAAATQVINQFITNPAVSFAGIVFSENNTRAVTPRFTRDSNLLDAMVESFNEAQGRTPYQAALEEAIEFIRNDILQTSEDLRARTRYDIQWLSDGEPTDGTTSEIAVQFVEDLRSLRQEFGLFNLTLSTIALTGAGITDEARGILSDMSGTGAGTYQEVSDSDLEFKVNFTEIVRAMEARQFLLVNHSRMVLNGQLLPDSDHDGVEDDNDPNPIAANTEQFWCHDGITRQLQPNLNLCESICEEELLETNVSVPVDSDGDGLVDCAEKAMGFHYGRRDSDMDGIYDALELRFRTNPHDGHPFEEDTDNDGVSNGDEVILGTDPNFPEADDVREYLLAYRYQPLVPVSSGGGVSCYAFEVDNVRLAHTLQTETSLEGENLLCVYLSQTPVDNPNSDHTIARACTTARFLQTPKGDVKVPANGIIEIAAEDFAPVN